MSGKAFTLTQTQPEKVHIRPVYIKWQQMMFFFYCVVDFVCECFIVIDKNLFVSLVFVFALEY